MHSRCEFQLDIVASESSWSISWIGSFEVFSLFSELLYNLVANASLAA